MEFLIRTGGRVRLPIALAAVLTVATGLGCALLSLDALGGEPTFSHRLHVGEEGLACINCHEDALVAERPAMPPVEQCQICHDVIDEGKSPEHRVEALFSEQRYAGEREGRLGDEVIFSHAGHADGGLACADCHADVRRSRRSSVEQRVDMDECVACHSSRGLENDCAVCHEVVDQSWAPANHRSQWRILHGSVACSGSPAAADSCFLCHRESTCAECHRIEEPRSHTNFFRRRGHGQLAAMDRDRCAACHEPDTCDSCHREARPMNHSGAWGGSSNVHCYGCHFPLEAEGCSTCHLGTPSHLSAAPLPADHSPAWDCRQCHGVTTALPHPDNGDACQACHF